MKVILVVVIMSTLSFGQLTGREIMEKVDTQPEPKSVISTMEMTLISEKRGKIKERRREITRYQKNYATGDFESKSLIRFLYPADVKGTGFLMWEYVGEKDDDQWLFLPALGKVKRIAAREKSENFMGSDFSYEDIGERDINDDTFEFIAEDSINGILCYKIKAIPVDKDASYLFRHIWVDTNNWIMKKVEYFDKRGALLKILEFIEQQFEGEYWSIFEMRMENVQNNHKTIMKISNIQYDTGISNDYFTERFLTRVQ